MAPVQIACPNEGHNHSKRDYRVRTNGLGIPRGRGPGLYELLRTPGSGNSRLGEDASNKPSAPRCARSRDKHESSANHRVSIARIPFAQYRALPKWTPQATYRAERAEAHTTVPRAIKRRFAGGLRYPANARQEKRRTYADRSPPRYPTLIGLVGVGRGGSPDSVAPDCGDRGGSASFPFDEP